VFGVGEDAAEASSRAQGEDSKSSKEHRLAGRAGFCSLVLIAGHLESVAACALRMCGTSVCVVCGASVCVVLRHHWALNECVHACA
jgi:hypothetical protein